MITKTIQSSVTHDNYFNVLTQTNELNNVYLTNTYENNLIKTMKYENLDTKHFNYQNGLLSSITSDTIAT